MAWNAIWHQAMAKEQIGFIKATGKNKTVVADIMPYQSGSKVRVRFENRYAPHGVRLRMSLKLEGKMYPVTLNGNEEMTIPEGGTWSDEIKAPVVADQPVQMRVYYPKGILDGNCIIEDAFAVRGNHVLAQDIAGKKNEQMAKQGFYCSIPSVSEIQVSSGHTAETVFVFGDSITAMSRWVEPVRRKIYEAYGEMYTVVNDGISGNCLTYSKPGMMKGYFGRRGIERFKDDIAYVDHIRTVIIALGTNDISYMTEKTASEVNLPKLKDAVTRLTDGLKSKGVRVVMQTVMPRKDYPPAKFTDEMEGYRLEFNEWIRNNTSFDYIMDASACLTDPDRPDHMILHQGDYLHPSREGGQALADFYDIARIIGA